MGIEVNLFVKTPLNFFICPRCNQVFDNCVSTSNEKMCFNCLQGNEKEISKVENLDHLIKNLEVYCKNKKLNCHWIGKYQELKNHLEICSYKPTRCTNLSCSWFGSKMNLENHLKNCYFQRCDKCDRLFKVKKKFYFFNRRMKDSLQLDEIKKLKIENENFKEMIKNLNKEIEYYKSENNLLSKESEKEFLRNKELNQHIDLLEITFQEKIQSLLQEKDISLMNEFVNENFDLLREQFVEDNIKLNQEIKELKRKNDEVLIENMKIKEETNNSLEHFRQRLIEMEKQNLMLKTNENYKELSKKLVTKSELLDEQNTLLREEMKNSTIKLLSKNAISKIVSIGASNAMSTVIVQLLNKFQKFVSNKDEKYRYAIILFKSQSIGL
jgi:hypothetical protein